MNRISNIKNALSILIFSALTLCNISCEKSQLIYEDRPGIYIDKEKLIGVTDSSSYSFAEKANMLMLDTFYIPVKISGNVSVKDRSIPLFVDNQKSSAISGTHYEMLETKLKANERMARVPIVLKRTADLKQVQVKLFIRIEASAEFPLPIIKTKTPVTTSGETGRQYNPGYLIKISDQLLKPDTWDSNGSWFLLFFGAYSATKYKFIIDVTRRTIWGAGARTGPEAPTAQQMRVYNAQLATALFEYEKINGTMIDENGNQVTFPKL